MNLKLVIPPQELAKLIPDRKTLAEAAAYGMEVLIRRHLREKNRKTAPNRYGLPKSNYYADASDTVRGSADGEKAVVEIGPDNDKGPGSGIALHYYGGTVYPKKKALAIPIDPSVAGIWPSEGAASGVDMFWPKHSSHGFLKDSATGALLWLLVPHATIPADPTVLPEESEILGAAEKSVLTLLEAS